MYLIANVTMKNLIISEENKNINSEVIKYFNTIKKRNIEGINNLTPSYNKLIISYDLKVTNYREIKDKIENLSMVMSRKIYQQIHPYLLESLYNLSIILMPT